MVLLPIGVVSSVTTLSIVFSGSQWAQAHDNLLGLVIVPSVLFTIFPALIIMTQVPSGIEGAPLPVPTRAEMAASKFAKIIGAIIFAYFILLIFASLGMLGG